MSDQVSIIIKVTVGLILLGIGFYLIFNNFEYFIADDGKYKKKNIIKILFGFLLLPLAIILMFFNYLIK